MEKVPTSNVTKGVIIALVIMVLSIITYFSGFRMDGWTQYLIYAVFTAGIIWSCIVYGKQLNGQVNFGSAFAHGFKVSAVVAVLMVAFVLVFALIFPDMKEKTLDTIREEMSKNPAITQEMLDKTVDMYTKWFTVIMIAGALFGYMFMGLLASLIGAAVTKKNPDSTHQRQV